MRNNTIVYILILFVSSLFSCEMKKDLLGDIEDPSVPKLPENAGLLDLTLNAEKEAEYPTKGSEIETGDSLFTDNFSIAIYDSVGTKVAFYETYAELKTDGGLILTPGKYTMSAENGDNVIAGFEKPYYAGEDTFVIESKQVAKVETSCVLSNKKLQFRCSDNFLENYSEDYSIVLDNGIGILTINKEEDRAAFMQNTGVLRMNIYVTDKNGEPVSYLVDLGANEEVKNHNNLMIDLDIVENGDGSEPGDGDDNTEPEDPGDGDKPEVPTGKPMIKVDVSLIEKDFVIEIPMDISGGDSGGSETPDPTQSVSITGSGFNIKEAIEVPISNAQKNIVVLIKAQEGMKNLNVTISSPGDILAPLLDGMGLGSSFDMCNPNAAQKKALLDLGFVLPEVGDKELRFDITEFVPLIGILNTPGDFKFTIKVTDLKGNSTTETLTIRMI